MTMSDADRQDKEFWTLAKEMFNEQTAGLPVRSWENSSAETRQHWYQAARFVSARALRQEGQSDDH